MSAVAFVGDGCDGIGMRLAILADGPHLNETLIGEAAMPETWSDKDERMYQHVKKSEMDRGRSEVDAKEIAARTVNQQRREEGRTANARTSGVGNPHLSLEDRSVQALRNRARELKIRGRSKMNKKELIAQIRNRND
jgi:hypothetical protein